MPQPTVRLTQTLHYYRYTLRALANWCAANEIAPINDLDAGLITRYLLSQDDRNLSAASVHDHARAVRPLLNFCAKQGLIPAAPKVTIPKLPKKILPAHHTITQLPGALTQGVLKNPKLKDEGVASTV